MLYNESTGKRAETKPTETKPTETKPTETKTEIRQWQVILSLAADKLETTGWIQGKFEKRYRGKCIGYCSLGAIRKVGGRTRAQYEAEAMLSRALNYLPIVSWNDHPARTKEEVVAKLREVAAG